MQNRARWLAVLAGGVAGTSNVVGIGRLSVLDPTSRVEKRSPLTTGAAARLQLFSRRDGHESARTRVRADRFARTKT